MLVTILVIIIVILLILLCIAGYYLYRFANTILRTEDAVEESIKILNVSYGNIGKILETPVGSDDPFVKSVVNEIKRAQDAVLVVANKLIEGWKSEEDE